MDLFTLCWLLGAGQTGFLCVNPLCLGGGPVFGVDAWAEGAGSEPRFGLLSSHALSAALVLCPPGEE